MFYFAKKRYDTRNRQSQRPQNDRLVILHDTSKKYNDMLKLSNKNIKHNISCYSIRGNGVYYIIL